MQSKDNSFSLMDSFKVYLPSNVSNHLYPENSPCNYRTRFGQPIDLDGHWEVGLESILYSTNINDESEKAQIDFEVKTDGTTKHKLTMDVFLGNHVKHEELHTYINQSVSTFLKQKLGDKYDTSQHSFSLSIYFEFHCKVIIGDKLTVRFSKNLSYLLGFPNKILKDTAISIRGVTSLSNRKRQLFVLTDAIKPTAYGNQKLQILQNFVHNSTGDEIIEKHFNPIVYLPVMHNYIDMIQIQLTDDLHQPLPIKDSKTIVTLYFRKTNGK